MIGQTVSHYKILEKLGEGGMGVVYKAQDTTLDRLVALKFLPPHVSASSDDKTRFVQEAKAASALNHPNILTIYDFLDEEGQSFIAMELVEGESLKTKVAEAKQKGSQLPISQVLGYADQIAQGLSKAHEKGIIHRDVKSDNIMVTNDGLIKIMDFGLAKLKGKVGMTRAGSTVGTAAYMSPEQIQGDEVNEQADIWSFGVVLFELLTGQHPFHGEHESAMMYSITNEDPKPLANLRSDAPIELRQIVERCLQKDRSKRYTSLSQILEEVSKLRPVAGIGVKAFNFKEIVSNLKRPVVAVPVFLVLAGLGYLAYWYVDRSERIRWAREKVLPEIERLAGESKWASAYFLARQVEPVVADDPSFVKLRPLYAGRGVIRSEPSGAETFIAEYGSQHESWISLGQTPTDTIFVPRGLWRLKLQKEGFVTIDGAAFTSLINQIVFKLDATGSIPDNMVRVPGGKYGLNIPGLDHLEPVKVGAFLIDKYETSNKEFKEFVESGGYSKRVYWKYPFVKNGRTLSWDEALREFVDATGRPGPSTWELGAYPEGKADYPVGGINWYEAAAFAEFKGKSLPTVYHWNVAAETRFSSFILPSSNFESKGPAPIGKYKGVSPFGPYDMAGNVREWCFNQSKNQRSILGGGWNDQRYMFNDFYAQLPFDRSPTNGVRCVKILEPDSTSHAAHASIELPHREFLRETPVSDQVFKIYLTHYKYDKTAFHEKIESSDTTADWITQKVTFDAAYGGERMFAYLFVPKVGTPPFQVVVYFPGSNVIYERSSKSLQPLDFIVKGGRAFMYPIYKGTFERESGLNSDYQNETNFYKEHVIAWAKDIGRSIDYLQTRGDIDKEKIAYYGLSWGGAMGAIMPVVEPRFKVSVLYVAGLEFQRALPEVDQINFIRHVKLPVLMLNGKYDQFFPVETSQKPFFALLGTPPEHKKYVLYETGHFVPRNQLIKESLDWLDKYLGPVK